MSQRFGGISLKSRGLCVTLQRNNPKLYMKRLIFLLTCVLMIMITSCSSKISKDPRKDATNMVSELVECARNNNVDKIEIVLSPYYEYYSKADLADRVAFLKSIDFDKIKDEDKEIWHNLIENNDFQNIPTVIRLDIMERDTKKEARALGIW